MRTLVISDLHLGNGGPYDSFAGEEALPALIDQYSGPNRRIFVNGDGVDFLMNEDPPALNVGRAVEQAKAIAACSTSAAVFQCLGRALAAGTEVVFRLGNHDLELALPEVQAVFRNALGQPQEVAKKLVFQLGDAPFVVEAGGVRVLITHGEENDPWNKVDDYKALVSESREFKFAPGSLLVKKILNPLTTLYRLKFVNLLKPDFQGAALAALAVAPTAVKLVLQGATANILWQLFRKSSGPASFVEDEDMGLAKRIEGAGLSADEQEAMEAFFGDGALAFSDDETQGPFGGARMKMAKAGLKLYARFQRELAGQVGDSFFGLEPTPDEWKEAQRLASKFNVSVVIVGHTHAARWGQKDGLLFANTGTWIWLMKLPPADAGNEEWIDFLGELRSNPKLDPEQQKIAKTMARFTAVTLEANPTSGLRIDLVEWIPGKGVQVLKSAVLGESAQG